MTMPMDTAIQFLSIVSKVQPLEGFPGMTMVVLITGQVLLYKGDRMVIMDPVEDVGCFGIMKIALLLRADNA